MRIVIYTASRERKRCLIAFPYLVRSCFATCFRMNSTSFMPTSVILWLFSKVKLHRGRSSTILIYQSHIRYGSFYASRERLSRDAVRSSPACVKGKPRLISTDHRHQVQQPRMIYKVSQRDQWVDVWNSTSLMIFLFSTKGSPDSVNPSVVNEEEGLSSSPPLDEVAMRQNKPVCNDFSSSKRC